MEEQILPIGIDSELEHVKSEIDRIDGIFTVATGPMGHQEINYHIITEERDYHATQQTLPHIITISESLREKSSLKLRSSSIQYQHISEIFDSEKLNTQIEDQVSNKSIISTTIDDDDDRKGRFSLPEIESSNQQEKTCQIKKVNNSLKYFQKEQIIPNQEQQSSPSLSYESTLEIPEHCRPNVNNTLQQQIDSLLPFYTLNELAQHNDSTDAWICIFSHIYDITSLIKKHHTIPAYKQLIDYAGQDISSWFDEQTHEPRKRLDPHTHELVPLIKIIDPPFWQTKDFLIGRLTEHPRHIRLIHNFAPKQSYLLEVAEEETVGQIAKKFLKYNSHIYSYIWRYNGQILDLNKTLSENGIPNEELFHDKYGWRSDTENSPTIILYFSDDLTIA